MFNVDNINLSTSHQLLYHIKNYIMYTTCNKYKYVLMIRQSFHAWVTYRSIDEAPRETELIDWYLYETFFEDN